MAKKTGGGWLRSLLRLLWLPNLPAIRRDLLLAGICGVVLGVGAPHAASWAWGTACSLVGWLGGGVAFTQGEVARARGAARQAAGSLDHFLGRGRDADGWRHYLRLHDLRDLLDMPSPPTDEDKEKLAEILDRFSRKHGGLEMSAFANVRTTLSTYLKMLKLADHAPEEPPIETAAGRWRSIR